MSESLHPTQGVRVLLRRTSIADDKKTATYDASIYTPTELFRYTAELRMDGSAEVAAASESADSELEDFLTKIASSIARVARRHLDEALPPWPERVHRWHG